MAQIAPEIFKAYDIRGIVGKTLTEETAYLIGRAFAARAAVQNIRAVAVGRDGRLSGPALLESLIRGLTDSGMDVTDIGMVATPMLYFAAVKECGGSGMMITGSHNPPDYNGFKMMLGGETLAGEAIQELLASIRQEQFTDGKGSVAVQDIYPAYEAAITAHIQPARPMKIVIDAGNGVAGAYAGRLYRALGFEVEELFCNVDGHFPNHHPDPAKPENLQDLIRALQNGDAEIGLAFDGDGDRLGVVTKDSNIIYPDRQLMLFAQDVLSRNPNGKVIFDVKSTRLLAPWIRRHGGQPLMGKTGHSFIKSAMKREGALLAGEMSGHTFFKERWLRRRHVCGLPDARNPLAQQQSFGHPQQPAAKHFHARTEHRPAGRRKRPRAYRQTGRHRPIRRCGRSHHHRRPARGIFRRLRPDACIQYHAGSGAAF